MGSASGWLAAVRIVKRISGEDSRRSPLANQREEERKEKELRREEESCFGFTDMGNSDWYKNQSLMVL